jgi:hypothetical protein
MEKQPAQIMLDTMHLVCEPLEKRVAELEAQVREFKLREHLGSRAAVRARQLRHRRQPWRCPAVCSGDAAKLVRPYTSISLST